MAAKSASRCVVVVVVVVDDDGTAKAAGDSGGLEMAAAARPNDARLVVTSRPLDGVRDDGARSSIASILVRCAWWAWRSRVGLDKLGTWMEGVHTRAAIPFTADA